MPVGHGLRLRLRDLAEVHQCTGRVDDGDHPAQLRVPGLTHEASTGGLDLLRRGVHVDAAQVQGPHRGVLVELGGVPQADQRRTVVLAGGVPEALVVAVDADVPARELVVELGGLVEVTADQQLVPDRGARLAGGEEGLVLLRLLQADGRTRGVDQHGHLAALAHVARGEHRGGTGLHGVLVGGVDVRGVQQHAPEGGLVVRDLAEAGDGHPLLLGDGVATARIVVLPAEDLGIEVLGRLEVRRRQINPDRHAGFGNESGHQRFLHFSGSKSSSAVASSK